MRTVYLDELFLLNLVIDYFLLLATAKICALPFRRRRFALAAAFGGLWSALSLLPRCSVLGRPILHPVLALALCLIAFGRERKLWRCVLAFLGVSALFGGAVYAAGIYRGVWRRDGSLVRLDLRVLVLSFAVCWVLVSLVFRRSAKNAPRRLYEVVLERETHSVRIRALADTGNGLYDPVTGCSVLIVEASAAAPLFSREVAAHITDDPVDALPHLPGGRLIPYAGVDGTRRLLLAFRPDRITVDGETRHDLLAAIVPAGLGGDGSYDAIL